MDRVLCIILCLILIVVSVWVLASCGKPTLDSTTPTAEPTTQETTQETTEVTEETTVATDPPTVPETEPIEETTVATEPPYTAEELEMMALVIYQEAGGDSCSDETRLMVGTVVMNRLADSRFPDTLHEVLTQEGQYGLLYWTGLVWPERASNEIEAHAVERAYRCAERILLGERFLPGDVIFQAEFEQGTETVAYSDGMYFCR